MLFVTCSCLNSGFNHYIAKRIFPPSQRQLFRDLTFSARLLQHSLHFHPKTHNKKWVSEPLFYSLPFALSLQLEETLVNVEPVWSISTTQCLESQWQRHFRLQFLAQQLAQFQYKMPTEPIHLSVCIMKIESGI